jgi:hypothetical protein
MYYWTHLLIARAAHLLPGSNIHKSNFCEFFLWVNSGEAEPQCQATPVKFGSPHETICAGFIVDKCQELFIPTDLQAQFPTRAAGAGLVGTSSQAHVTRRYQRINNRCNDA